MGDFRHLEPASMPPAGSTAPDIASFLKRPEAVALAASSSELFGVFTRSMEVPAGWVAVAHSGDGAVLHRASDRLGANAAGEFLFVRASPFSIAFSLLDLVTSDGFSCDVQVQVELALVLEPAELLAFQRGVMGSFRAVTTLGIARFLEGSIRLGMETAVRTMVAEDLIEGRGVEKVEAALPSSLAPVCFSTGLSTTVAPRALLRSQAWERHRAELDRLSRLRTQADAVAAVQYSVQESQRARVAHLVELHAGLHRLAAERPGTPIGELLREFAAEDRAAMYDALLASSSATVTTRWIAIAAGQSLFFFDPRGAEHSVKTIPLGDLAGPVRSVQYASESCVLWVGAAVGVHRVLVEGDEVDFTLVVESPGPVRGGFNSVAAGGDRVWAAHSELGIHEWRLDQPGASRRVFAGMTESAKSVRAVVAELGRVYCGVGGAVCTWEIAGAGESPSDVFPLGEAPITAICVSMDEVFVGDASGRISTWSQSDSRVNCVRLGEGRAVESIHVVDSGGVRRLVYTDTSLHVHSQVCGDSHGCRYEAGGQTLRRVEAAADFLAATTELRDRLIVWRADRPQRPDRVIALASMFGRTIQDACFIPRSSQADA